MKKKVLCLIPTLNASNEIENLILELLNQIEVDLEILVIDSSSSDDTVKILKKLSINFLVIDKKDFNHANTRNLVLNYKADYYLFMTQDAIPCDKCLIINLLKSFTDYNTVISYARQIPKNDADDIEIYARVIWLH